MFDTRQLRDIKYSAMYLRFYNIYKNKFAYPVLSVIAISNRFIILFFARENILPWKLRRDLPYNILRFAFSRLQPSPHYKRNTFLSALMNEICESHPFRRNEAYNKAGRRYRENGLNLLIAPNRCAIFLIDWFLHPLRTGWLRAGEWSLLRLVWNNKRRPISELLCCRKH